MDLWHSLFLYDLVIPAAMVIIGSRMASHPPRYINRRLGYRTVRSMRNPETWRYAHKVLGHIWKKVGWPLLVLSVLVQLPFRNSPDASLTRLSLILVLVQMGILLCTVIPTEKALKLKFDDMGNPR